MSSCNYALTKRIHNGAYYYGIEITTSDGEDFKFDLISPCESDASRLIEQMSRGDISIVHFKDIIRDFLTEKYLSAIEDNNLVTNT